MSDYGTRQTDLAVKRVEWRLSRVYRQAQRDIDEKIKSWEKGHAAREAAYRQQLKDGKITQEDFDGWMRGQVFQEQQWQAKKQQIDQILLDAERQAQQIVNNGKLDVFATNANYMGYELEQHGKVRTSFGLYDANTVSRLIKRDPQILPKPAPGVKKDKAYTYYNKLMTSAITQGIVQGETIPEITQRIIDKTGESCFASAIRNARTAFTGAQNAGRMEGLHQAQEMGIQVKKRWLATLDDRTRDTHADLDGQTVDVDEPFVTTEGNEIMYPGDPTAEPSEVYNCRCTLVYVYPEYPSDMERRDNENGEIIDDMTYREWEEYKNTGVLPQRNTQELDVVESALGIERQSAFDVDDAVDANPNYSSDRSYRVNCQMCVQAYELRRRGYDVEALPRPDNNSKVVWGNECFLDSGQNALDAFTMDKTEAALKKEFKSAPDGARYVVYCKWKGRNTGAHVFIAEKTGEKVRYVDPQSGNKDVSWYFDSARKGAFGFCRVDDKSLTTDKSIIQATVRKKGKNDQE